MALVKIVDNSVAEYPYSTQKLKRDNANVSFPSSIPEDILSNYGVYHVHQSEIPDYNERTQNLAAAETPTLVDGTWTLSYIVSDKTAEETQAYDNGVALSNREKRNELLAETDFYALSDVTMASEMQSYRQSLRDITTHANWPNLSDSDWPTKP